LTKPKPEFFDSESFPLKKKETRDSLFLKLFKKPEPEAIKKQPPNTGTNHG
jgi:hypothetical protein